ncbi:MAG: hypothetical protein JSS30_07515 [Verrucomicrobia bacterium]|nr:hypothetical protein [Verrucomicrobiota bacterium]
MAGTESARAPGAPGAYVEFLGQRYDIGQFFGGRTKEESTPEVVETQEKVREDAGEFYIIARDFFVVDLNEFTDKYPFISAVATVACAFFALPNILSFSLNIVTGVFLAVLSYGLGKSLWRVENVTKRIWANAWNATKIPEESLKAEEASETDEDEERPVKAKAQK